MGRRQKLAIHRTCYPVRVIGSPIIGPYPSCSIATDLNLHHVSTSKSKHEKDEREALNRARVWMICFNLDRSTATQFGKPSTIKED